MNLDLLASTLGAAALGAQLGPAGLVIGGVVGYLLGRQGQKREAQKCRLIQKEKK